MRLVLISDTHNQQGGLVLPAGDVLVHASVERFILHLVASAYRRQGYRSIAEFREWLAGIGLDIVRSS